MPNSEEALAVIELYRDCYTAAIPQNNFDRVLWERLQILSASIDDSGKTSKVTFSIVVPKIFANHVQTMHGGAVIFTQLIIQQGHMLTTSPKIATLFDGLTSSCLALFSQYGCWNGKEVTRSLEIKYFKPVPLEEQLNAECEIVHAGQRLASLRGVITRASDGSVLAACQHEKFNSNGGAVSKL